MRSSRQKKRSKMIVSMVSKPNTHRSKSRSLSKTKTRPQNIGDSYRPVRISRSKSKSRSVPKQRHAFNTSPQMATIDEPAAKIFDHNFNKHSPKNTSKGPKIIKLKKK